ncbi:exodeoxyribonuclease V subunit alpha [Pandoraea cepalis]|uniref:RecBCD enzyme subunit RecD n=1 Tax=Pandoraea cepalis TaxID=2508294 RepID=A0AAW7MQ72_9BURK|nr:exodeoxyribonuclease V subunit alpha [Pandoraea cepalis]MDN4574960.1 exodeoxyribonuclease V subunit alpha [Pandoraea cepalis]MDN4579030.1 exodeoxyribonuclease V subunit alpha [Pandoraea cepalis]
MSDRRDRGDVAGAPLADSGVVRLAQGFARRMALLARGHGADEPTCRYVWRAALAVSLATAEGHVCVPLDNLLDGQASGELFPGDAPALSVWREALFASGLCAPASLGLARTGDLQADAFPLLLDDHDRLYLARYYSYEARLATALGRKLSLTERTPVTAADRARLHRYFGEGALVSSDGLQEPNWQMAAAALALQRPLVVLSGGPGTGKTTTVVGLLACLLERDANLRVALAAPTGKAAQRMQEALTARRDLPETVRRALPEAAVTLHRLLGVLPESAEQVGRRFRHHAGNPLPYDLIVVDEASMIDLSMATQLLEAVPESARLILLGDKDQLAAVEAGAVFGELSAQRMFSPDMRARLLSALEWPVDAPPRSGPLAAVVGNGAPDAAAGSAQVSQGLEDTVVWLERTYRFGENSAIGRLATAIKSGKVIEARKACTLADDGALAGIGSTSAPAASDADRVMFSEDGGVQLSPASLHALADGYSAYLAALAEAVATIEQLGDPATVTAADVAMVAQPVFAAFGQFRVLCATRGGRRGVELLGAQLTAVLARRAGMALGAGGGAWFAGRPVLVTQNEYALNLFNGDIGIALPLGPSGTLRVAFATPDGGYRLYSPASLPAHETAFAMTIHKSQGSEFERVAMVLPEQASRVLSRELIYTGVTRARRQVWLYAPWQVVASAIARPTQRDGGLTDRLMEVLATMPPSVPAPPPSLPR